ncbi:SRPBCC family protein [Corynebacterium glutamicum]|uniref:SRPBCC family protein n=1 Tax=Corynebacterium glutamicum TaxID=1718 RepID=UPI00072218F5|nr:SRPBCC family protein [Corynebacterium glutamicum]ALP49484.1 ATPase [Corynebacterium glutamicum]
MASDKDLQVSTFVYISRCPVQVYEAIADPKQLERYFATGGVSGRLETGSTVYWDFADFPGAFPVQVVSATQAEHIELRWGQANELRSVNFEFEPFRDFTRTKLTITEGSWPLTPAGAQEALGSQMGWTGMLSALKAWLEYGVNLRDGFYKQ